MQNLTKSKTGRSVSCLEASSNALPSLFLVFSEPMCKQFPRMAQYHFADYPSYMFDEPSSYLDVKQRLSAARTIRELLRPDDYVIVVEHDLSVLDYLSDFICVLYGRPAVYGVVTLPASVREGINIFLDGNIPTENLRFREESLTFRIAEAGEEFMVDRARRFSYPKMVRIIIRDTLYSCKGLHGKAHRSIYLHAWSNTKRLLRFFVVYF